jgi:hypothetical protein
MSDIGPTHTTEAAHQECALEKRGFARFSLRNGYLIRKCALRGDWGSGFNSSAEDVAVKIVQFPSILDFSAVHGKMSSL